jgi:hypothetical protein
VSGRALIVGAFLLVLLAHGSPAMADETDYLPDNPDWNGCSELASLARGFQLRLELLEVVDWSALPEHATLLVVYPTADLDVGHLIAFLKGGGRVLIADDFGRSGHLLEAFGIRRVAGRQVQAQRFHNDNPNLPVATAGPAAHGLNEGLSEVVANHPAHFLSTFPTLVGFDRDGKQQLLVAGKLGKGRFVALADPSVLINAMLRFEGNATLANNILQYLRPPADADRIFIVTRSFREIGAPDAADQSASSAYGVQQFLADYGAFLGRINDFAPKEATFRVLVIVAGAVGLVALVLLIPLPRRELSGHWLRPGETAHPGNGGAVGVQESAAFSAAVLREELEEVLTERLRAPGPVFTIHPKWVIRRVHEEAGDEAATICSRLLTAMKNVSHSASLSGIAALGAVRKSDLAAMYALSRALLIRLGRDTLPEVSSQANDHG